MAHSEVVAEYQEGKRIVFTARERAAVNVRVAGSDGEPVGYTSYELLLMALANCTLGVVRNHASLDDLEVTGCRAILESESGSSPSRIERINVRVELEVAGGSERLQQTLQRVADACPIGNTLKLPPEITVSLVLNGEPAAALAAAGE